MVQRKLIKHCSVICVAACGVIQTAAAQDDVIANCAAQTTAEARIECLEAALRGQELAAPTPPVPAASGTAPPDTSDTASVGTNDTAAMAKEAPAVQPDQPSPVAAVDAPAGLGAEQVAARTPARKDRAAAEVERSIFEISSHKVIYPNRLQITLNNGQVWQQIRGDDQRIRLRSDRDTTAEIWKSRLGGYKLRFPESRRTVRVRRLR